ncbi:tyrosine-type recombinase/integrase [Microcoleus sp. MON1_C5]|uniref:tyrosine-type recombinase/integrase n=1 Tax=Microcoleus sp. MON1_C5 TaxID=2818828 RepID=UPI002FCEBEB4
MTRNQKGSVVVCELRGMLRLRLPRHLFGGQQKYLYLGLPDTPINRSAAEEKARAIAADIAFGKFDTSLQKYQSLAVVLSKPKTEYPLTLGELWEKYTAYKAQHLAATTIKKDFAVVDRHITKTCGDLNQAHKIRLQLIEQTTIRSAKKSLMQINACCNWAVEFNLIQANPFEKIKIKARKPPADIQPFTEQERDRIIKAFKETEEFYAPLIEFLFLTGCRPSEAIALRWKHIDADASQITFCEAFVYGVSKGTKTSKSRIFPVNPKLRSLLKAIERGTTDGDSLVFPSKTGLIIDGHNLGSRQWDSMLENLNIRQRPIYNCRHTFISHCLAKGIQVRQVATWVGNSPRTIWEHYAGLIATEDVPQ